MNRILLTASLALLLAHSLAVTGFAADGKGAIPMGLGKYPLLAPAPEPDYIEQTRRLPTLGNVPIDLVRSPVILEEIALSKEQQARFLQIIEEFRPEMRKHAELQKKLGRYYRASCGSSYAAFHPGVTAFRQKAAETGRKFGAVLRPDQLNRLAQIALQRKGTAAALQDARVIGHLKITYNQRKQMSDVQREAARKQKQLVLDTGRRKVDRLEARTRKQELNRQAEQAVLNILTDEQRSKFSELIGKKFN